MKKCSRPPSLPKHQHFIRNAAAELIEYCNYCQNQNDIYNRAYSGNSGEHHVVSVALLLSEKLLSASCDGSGEAVALAGLKQNADYHENAREQQNHHKYGMHLENLLKKILDRKPNK